MYCTQCGHKSDGSQKFCTQCGAPLIAKEKATTSPDNVWKRLAKVAYILMHVPLLLVVPAVWDSYAVHTYTDYYGHIHTYGSDSDAFWYSLLALLIYMALIRLIKLGCVYIVAGQRPEWKKELRKLF